MVPERELCLSGLDPHGEFVERGSPGLPLDFLDTVSRTGAANVFLMKRFLKLHRSRENSTVVLIAQIKHLNMLPYLCHLFLFLSLKCLKENAC